MLKCNKRKKKKDKEKEKEENQRRNLFLFLFLPPVPLFAPRNRALYIYDWLTQSHCLMNEISIKTIIDRHLQIAVDAGANALPGKIECEMANAIATSDN
jgi:hypothetical protein